MPDGTTGTPEIFYSSSPSQQVEEFITRVWEHPLLDQQTIEFRQKAKNELTDVLVKHGFDPEGFVTIPVGSLIWATDSQSDLDYILVFKNPDDRDRFLDPPWEFRLDTDLVQKHIDIVANETAEYHIDLASRCASLLLTPDEYIGGNIQLAKELRLKSVNRMIDHKYGEDNWQHEVGEKFEILFRRWDDSSSKMSKKFRTEKQDPERSRTKRIADRLELRSNETHNPEKYKTAFNKARKAITLPSLKTYTQAIIENKGSLSLLPKLASQNLSFSR